MGTGTTLSLIATAECQATRITGTTMPETPALLRLMTWLSPAFPVGSFSYSHGLESAVHDGLIGNREELEDWLAGLLAAGSLWNDAVLAAHALRASDEPAELAQLAEFAEALAGSAERHLEATKQGQAFLEAVRTWRGSDIAGLPGECAYAVAFGAAAGTAGITAEDAVAGLLQATITNLTQVAIRLSVIGQSDGVRIAARLEAEIAATAKRASGATLDDLGTGTLLSEIAAMRHETMHTRLFRT
ncbi:MAG: urease accessory protein UreF [Rhizobiaceae bacterium]|nr:urease accessory protein UreF [Rhizobiaceae bacterium]